jgi:hypothetical protein
VKISGISVRGVSGLPDLEIDLRLAETGAPPSLVVVRGPPASGKTRLLETIVAARETVAPITVSPDPERFVRPGLIAAKATLILQLTDGERDFAGAASPELEIEAIFRVDGERPPTDESTLALLRRWAHDGQTGKLEMMPVWRALPSGPAHATTVAAQREARVLTDARRWAFVPRFLDELGSDPARGEAFARRLAALSPTCRWIPDSSRFEGHPGARSLDLLAASEQDAVLFAATATLIGLDHSVLLVDRPEKHLPAELVPGFVRGLFELGEDLQVIVATDVADFPEVPSRLTVEMSA